MRTMKVTGADKGLGYSLAERFAGAGFRVFAGHLGDGAALAKLGKAQAGRVTPIRQDVTDMTSIRASVQAVATHTDRLDLLINNAGICLPDVHNRLDEMNLENGSLEKTFAVNAFGPLRVTQAFMTLLERGDMKKIVTVTSEAGSIGANWRDYGYVYCMSKSACNMFCQILQRALKPQGFKVLIFHPGWMQTDMGGTNAHITPEVAAEGIYQLTMREWSLDDPMYMDYTGKLFPW